MKCKHTTKNALLLSMMSMLLCITMLMGTTFAWFTDEASSNGNKIVAGTLDVDLLLWNGTDYVDIGDSKTPIFGSDKSLAATDDNANTLWEPGKTQVAYLAIKNNGNLDLKYQVALEVYDEVNNLLDVLSYTITNGAKFGDVTEWAGNGVKVQVGTNATQAESVVLKAGQEHFFALSIHMDEDANNDYQNGSAIFDVKVLATQLDSELDSFDNKYDAGAEYTTEVSSLEELRAALARGGNITLATDIVELDSANVVPTGVASGQPNTLLNITKDVVLNLNGHTISLNSSGTTTGSVINVQGATLDIRGDGKIVTNDESDSAGWLNGIWAGQDAVVNIYGGEFSGKTGCVLYGFKNGVINVYGGTYIVNTDSEYYDSLGRWLNVNNNNANTYITVYGGTFVNFDFECPNMTQSNHDKGNVSLAPNTEVTVTMDDAGNVYRTVSVVEPEGISVTADNIDSVDFTQDNVTYVLEGTFTESIKLSVNKGLNQTYDASLATFSSGTTVTVNAPGVAHSYADLSNERTGNVIIKGFAVDTLNVLAYANESVTITDNTVGAMSVIGGNFKLILDGNTVDGDFGKYTDGEGQSNEYGISLRITDYELSITNNVITDTYSHAIGINGRQGEAASDWGTCGANNSIKAFSGNKITVNTTQKTERAALKIWCDQVYAPYATSGYEPNANAKALMTTITADTTNVFTLGEGHTTFNIFDYKQ